MVLQASDGGLPGVLVLEFLLVLLLHVVDVEGDLLDLEEPNALHSHRIFVHVAGEALDPNLVLAGTLTLNLNFTGDLGTVRKDWKGNGYTALEGKEEGEMKKVPFTCN